MLPDDILLAIFDFYLDQAWAEAWQLLVHVCRRWRSVVFGSPRRLKLRLICTPETPARDTLDVWPPLPLFIQCYGGYRTEAMDSIVAALERRDRVRQINLTDVRDLGWETVSAAMEEPFLELTHLHLQSPDEIRTPLPDSFLGGSAPRLRHLWLNRISFLDLPTLLLSATDLVDLRLRNIPNSGYVSPEAMVPALAALTSLEELWLEFQPPGSPYWPRRLLPSVTRTLLTFKGVSGYLDDLAARIDAPRVNSLVIAFFDLTVLFAPRFAQFISRTPALNALNKTRINLGDGIPTVNLSSQTSGYGEVDVEIPYRNLDWQLLSLRNVCTTCLPPLSTMECLYIHEKLYSQRISRNHMDNGIWLEILQAFIALRNIYLSKEVARHIVPFLQQLVGDRTREVLINLQNNFLEELEPSGPVQEGIGKFAAARQLSGYLIAVSLWEKDSDWDSDSEWK